MLSIIHEIILLKLVTAMNSSIKDVIELNPELVSKFLKLNQKAIKLVIKTLPFDLAYKISFSFDSSSSPDLKSSDFKLSIDSLISDQGHKSNNNKHEKKSEYDLYITLTPGSVVRAGLTNIEQAMREQDIKFNGDLNLAMCLQDILNNTEFDVKETVQVKMAEVTSDAFAWRFIKVLDRVLERVNIKHNELIEQVSDYLLLETKVIVNKIELDQFYQDVDKLRDDVERLKARANLVFNN